MARKKVLIVGAQRGSLGGRLASLLDNTGFEVHTVGVSGQEDGRLDVTSLRSIHACLQGEIYEHVVCTTGINEECGITAFSTAAGDTLRTSFDVNAIGPLMLLRGWIRMNAEPLSFDNHFVAISSNSAHVARTNSMAYCMSKAALSMGLRCAGRDLARARMHGYKNTPVAYGYEPGWIEGTPMSKTVEARLSEHAQLHRIPTGEGLSKDAIARIIRGNLTDGYGPVLNGCMIRLDGGEQ